jgi:hypothetical protein
MKNTLLSLGIKHSNLSSKVFSTIYNKSVAVFSSDNDSFFLMVNRKEKMFCRKKENSELVPFFLSSLDSAISDIFSFALDSALAICQQSSRPKRFKPKLGWIHH